MKTEKRDNASSQNIMQVFQNANNTIAESSNIDEMITAYDKVIKFCAENSDCRNKKSTKRDVLLYWAYNNIANSYRKKIMPEIALKYYEKALDVAVSDKQKTMALEAILEAIAQENLRVSEKCRKILKITKQLSSIYRKNDDIYDLKRILELSAKTRDLLKKAGE